MAKVVVTGGSGFIGSHVVDVLMEAGHEVTVIDHRVRPYRDDVNFEDVDLMEMSSVLAATKGADHVFHLAAVSNVNYAYKYPVYTTALNVIGTAHVLEAARINGVQRVHLASTVWVYNGSPDGKALHEAVPFYLDGAGHLYTSTKMASEMLCHNYSQLYNVPFTGLYTRVLVQPGDPVNSYILNTMDGTFGDDMRPLAPTLTPSMTSRVRLWILQGALHN